MRCEYLVDFVGELIYNTLLSRISRKGDFEEEIPGVRFVL